MEIQIAFNERLGILSGGVHDSNSFPHGGEHFFIDSLRGQGGDFGFENLADFREVCGAFGLAAADHAVERLLNTASISVGDEGAAAGIGFDEPLFTQGFYRLANGGAADAKLLRELGGCEILFISGSERANLPEILEELRAAPVLTVGECEDFATRGGEVQFTLEENHVHFLINVDATERAGLKVSSKLLSLAHVVHGDPLRKKS